MAIEIFKISSQRIIANPWGNVAQPPTIIAQGHCPNREQHRELVVPDSSQRERGLPPSSLPPPGATLSLPKRQVFIGKEQGAASREINKQKLKYDLLSKLLHILTKCDKKRATLWQISRHSVKTS